MFTSKNGKRFPRFFAGGLVNPGRHTGDYVQVHLYDGRGRRRYTTKLVHAVVLEAFVGPRPPGHEALHGDHNRKHNALSNLRWGTKRENEDDKIAAGRTTRGEKSAHAKLTVAHVREIRRRVGEPQQDLADEFGCTFSNISAIQLRKSWRHV